ncbi:MULTISPECIES: hypothetical protein [unclassified Marinovum]
MRLLYIVTMAASVALVPAIAFAAKQERLCRFERQTLDGVTRAVDLPVIVDGDGHRGEVLIATGGRYSAKLARTTAGATQVAFATDVSRETMMIGPGGETLWQIDFHDGKTMAYAGHCGPNRKR